MGEPSTGFVSTVMKNIKWLLVLLLRRESIRWRKGFASGEDVLCHVDCACGNCFSVSDHPITWCSQCGLGYNTEFRCYRYPTWVARILEDL